jgi:hypothetical protein
MTKVEIDRLCSVQENWVKCNHKGQDDYNIRWMLNKISKIDPNITPEEFKNN